LFIHQFLRLKAAKNTTVIEDEVIQVIAEKINGHPYLMVFSMSELLMYTEGKENIGLDELHDAWPNIECSLGKMFFSQKFQIASDKE